MSELIYPYVVFISYRGAFGSENGGYRLALGHGKTEEQALRRAEEDMRVSEQRNILERRIISLKDVPIATVPDQPPT